MRSNGRWRQSIVLWSIVLLLTAGLIALTTHRNSIEDRMLSYEADAQDLQFYWKNDSGDVLRSIANLKAYVESKALTLTFATNGGMFTKDHAPLGLFVQDQQTLAPLDTARGDGNFYLQPNGVFYITTDNVPVVCQTSDFKDDGTIQYATQSGPMLIIDGQIHPAFRQGSSNLQIRNGVGILPDNRVVFAMSTSEISFYDLATYFQGLGCRNALYLDGFVSRTYLPEKEWIQTDGDLGVMIGVTSKESK